MKKEKKGISKKKQQTETNIEYTQQAVCPSDLQKEYYVVDKLRKLCVECNKKAKRNVAIISI